MHGAVRSQLGRETWPFSRLVGQSLVRSHSGLFSRRVGQSIKWLAGRSIGQSADCTGAKIRPL
eukprot:57438-Chlamydomonas_euryale.AAC.1